jgi:hypothetical protein
MSSLRKIDSARANGAKSHGPVTEEGRKKSSMNAITHGLNARTPVLFNETDDEHAALLDSYVQDLQPVGPAEMAAVIDMVDAKWRQRRLLNIESEMFERQMMKQKKEVDAAYESYNEVIEHTFAFRALSESRGLALVSQMESRIKRDYSRALSDLLRLRRLRASTPVAENTKNEKRTESQDRTPTTDHQPPITTHRPPTTNHHPPPTNHRSPPTNHHPPFTNHESPTTDHQPPTTNHHPPPTTHHPT